ncbi:MAG: hypothetical protein M0001_06905 [Treponema sp.]|nr:hypothetical protein [Treponema sp.]
MRAERAKLRLTSWGAATLMPTLHGFSQERASRQARFWIQAPDQPDRASARELTRRIFALGSVTMMERGLWSR